MKSLASVSVQSDERPKLPTLRQWLKSVGKGNIAQRHMVTVVWFPNQFPNFTFETEYYKVRVSENNPLFKQLRAMVTDWYMNEVPVAIAVDQLRDGSFDFVEAEGESVEWSSIGENGYKQAVLAKRDSAKPASQGKKGGA